MHMCFLAFITPVLTQLSFQSHQLLFLTACSLKFESYLHCLHMNLNPFPNKPYFFVSWVQVFWKHFWKKEKLLIMSSFSFSHSVFLQFREFSAFSSNLKLSSANSLSLDESKICRLGKGYKVMKNAFRTLKICQRSSWEYFTEIRAVWWWWKSKALQLNMVYFVVELSTLTQWWYWNVRALVWVLLNFAIDLYHFFPQMEILHDLLPI